MSGFQGEEFPIDQPVGAEPDDTEPEGERKRGFSDPEVLARAQATRAANREARMGVDMPTSDGKKRGRPPGSKKETRDLDGIIMLLAGIHQMVATATGFDDLEIDREEGALLAKALADLSEQYKIKITGKTAAAMGLLYAIVTVYGPRAFLIRKKLQERDKREPHTANVRPFPAAS